MLLDNTKNGAADKTVAGWLAAHAETGGLDVAAGRFTVGALAWLGERLNDKIERFRLVWGADGADGAKIDLLNREIGIRNALRLKKTAENAVKFLDQDKVEVKAAEPDFCRARLFLLNAAADGGRGGFVAGSSDLTEAGLGVGQASGAELNAASAGGGGEHKEFAAWFDALWNNPRKLAEAKQEFLDAIADIVKEYSPCDVYMKIISELLPEEVSREKIERRLEKTEIYKALFDFQRKAAVSLVKMLEKQNGAILADAVGLGKTFTALAVIKYYRMQNREVVVVAPKRRKHYWERYIRQDAPVFAGDGFDYEMIFHADLGADGSGGKIERLTNEKPKLFVIDESHNLSDDKGGRYQFLLDGLLRKNGDVKVLMLSAAPINGSFSGLRGRFKLIGGFENVDALFRRAQDKLSEWAKAERPAVGALISALRGIDGGNFLKLTDSLILARTRKMAASAEVSFPSREKPVNIFESPNCVDGAASISDVIDLLPIRFSAYMPAVYTGLTNKQVSAEDSRKALFLVKMMHILLIKRLESSWVSFKNTLEKITAYHKSVLQKLEKSGDVECRDMAELLQDEDSPEFDDLSVGKKQTISMKDIRDVNKFEKDLIDDAGKLDALLMELEKFSLAKDTKLKRLIETVEKHIQNAAGSRKALIFTAYGDTADYLFSCLRVYFGSRANVECVTADTKNIDDILNRFSPISKNAADRLKPTVDILIATDVISAGQNFQDCDFVANYDVHWNPARAVRRVGRVDRIGSPNKTVRCVNFWPSKDIEEYLTLRERVESRLSAMTVAGAEVPDGLADVVGKADPSDAIEQEQIKKSLRLMLDAMEDIEPETFGLSHLSLEVFRQDLAKESVERYKHLPHGIHSGFKSERRGLIALLQHKKSGNKRIAFINERGEEILSSRQEILQFLQDNKDEPRNVPPPIERCDDAEIDKLSQALRKWVESRISAEINVVMDSLFAGGQAALDLSSKQKEYLEETLAPDNWNLLCWEVVGDGG